MNSTTANLHPDIAFFLNKNASKVSEKTLDKIIYHIPNANIYISKDKKEAEHQIKSIINKNKFIFAGGGDGTLYNLINLIKKHSKKNLNESNIGLLGLGTGNGLATEVCSDNFDYVINKIKNRELSKTKEYNLIDVENSLVHFSSLGLDAQILNDFIEIKEEHPFLKKKNMGLLAYLTAYTTKTIHNKLLKKHWKIQVINEDESIYKISHSKGIELLPISKGELIYEGYSNLAGVGTASNYGFGFKVFPFAKALKNFMHLRIANINNLEMLAHPYSLWSGKYENENFMKDFLVKKVKISFSEPIPFQMGGDAKGYRNEILYSISDQKVNIVDFSNNIILKN